MARYSGHPDTQSEKFAAITMQKGLPLKTVQRFSVLVYLISVLLGLVLKE